MQMPMLDPNMVRPKPAGRDRNIVLGTCIIIIGLSVFFLWALFSPLYQGVSAQGSVVVEGQRKVVQHLEGGIVKSILVKEGDEVKIGDVVVEMDGTQSRANYDIVVARYNSTLAQVVRLDAIYNNSSQLVYPEELLSAAKDDDKLASTLKAQREVFLAYLDQYANQRRIYQQRLASLVSQRNAKQAYLGGIQKELQNLQILEKERLVEHAAVIARQRDYEETNSDINRLGAEIASARLNLSQLKIDTIERTSRELAEARKNLNDLKLQKDNLQDIVYRTEVRAPVDGKILRLSITGASQVIAPGGALMEIVPVDDKLVITAKLPANDRPGLVVGQTVRVNFTSLQSLNLPTIYGTLDLISADILKNPNASGGGMQAEKLNPSSFYNATVSVTPEELKKLGDANIEPGMPATVLIQGDRRTPIAYFLKPFKGLWNKAFIER
ncbi:MAG: HlyD family type I secretion periplasmic adaptor subunit [Alphaproteobacteria bacterium]